MALQLEGMSEQWARSRINPVGSKLDKVIFIVLCIVGDGHKKFAANEIERASPHPSGSWKTIHRIHYRMDNGC